MNDSNESFSRVWDDSRIAYNLIVSRARRIRSSVALFRGAAYDFAVSARKLMRFHYNEFRALIESGGLDVDAWMGNKFEIIEQMGDSRETLFKSIEDGMTRKEYIEDGQLWVVRNRIKAPTKIAQADTEPPALAEPLSLEEQIVRLRESNKAMRSELIQLRPKVVQLERDRANTMKEVDRLKKSAARANKILAAVNKKAG